MERMVKCPLTEQVFVEPVVVASANTYERKAIEAWFRKGHATDPQTGVLLPSKRMMHNLGMKEAVRLVVAVKSKVPQEALKEVLVGSGRIKSQQMVDDNDRYVKLALEALEKANKNGSKVDEVKAPTGTTTTTSTSTPMVAEETKVAKSTSEPSLLSSQPHDSANASANANGSANSNAIVQNLPIATARAQREELFFLNRPTLGYPCMESFIHFLDSTAGPPPLIWNRGTDTETATATLAPVSIVGASPRPLPLLPPNDPELVYAQSHMYGTPFRTTTKPLFRPSAVPISPYVMRLPRVPTLWYSSALDLGWALYGDAPQEKMPWQLYSASEVFLWLERVGLGFYYPLMVANRIASLDLLAQLEPSDLIDLKIDMAHARLMLRALKDLQLVAFLPFFVCEQELFNQLTLYVSLSRREPKKQAAPNPISLCQATPNQRLSDSRPRKAPRKIHRS